MSHESKASYDSKQLRQKNTHNLRNMKADSARRISRSPSSIYNDHAKVVEYSRHWVRNMHFQWFYVNTSDFGQTLHYAREISNSDIAGKKQALNPGDSPCLLIALFQDSGWITRPEKLEQARHAAASVLVHTEYLNCNWNKTSALVSHSSQ